MNRPIVRALPLIAAVAASAPAAAAGLQLWQQNAAGLGVAYAGSAASLENAGALYFNPATMTRLPGVQVSFGGAMAWPAYDYTDAAGGGMVAISMDGHKQCTGVKIDPEAAGDAEMLQDMVMAAFNEAARKVDEETQKKTAGMLGGLGLPPGLF